MGETSGGGFEELLSEVASLDQTRFVSFDPVEKCERERERAIERARERERESDKESARERGPARERERECV